MAFIRKRGYRKEMTIGSKEYYDIIAMFEKNVKDGYINAPSSFDKEDEKTAKRGYHG